jgi:hypothetical protein
MSRLPAAVALLVIVFAVSAAAIEFPALPTVISAAIAKVDPTLAALLGPLKQERAELLAKAAIFDKSCGHVAAGSAQDAQCAKDFPVLSAASDQHGEKSAVFMKAYASAAEIADTNTRFIRSMNASARQLGWDAKELARVDQALNSLTGDGDDDATRTQVIKAWRDVLDRGQDAGLAEEARRGDGPALFEAGTQTNFQDCAVFALATAAGLPYDVAAARAIKLIRDGEWRLPSERAHPQDVIKRHGLIGGEVVMLAEAFGEVQVVPSAAFAGTLKAGLPVIVNVVPPNGNFNGGHQVVLSKAFKHGGEAWYEMIDSNQGPQRRLYVSGKELHTMLQENGVTIRRDPNMTPRLLR